MNRDVRASLLGATAALMTMLTLSPLLAGQTWLQPVALVIVSVGLAGAAVAAADLPRWLSPPATAAAALVIATALLVPAQAAFGGFLPTRESLDALVILVRSGIATSQAVVAPAPTDAGVTAIITLASGAVAVLTVLIAGPLRHPGAAGLPLLLVVCVVTALAPGGIGLPGYVGAAIGYLGLTLTDSNERIRTWGNVLRRGTRDGSDAPPGVTQHLVTVAASTAAVALLAGALLPAIIPGQGGQRLQQMVESRFGASVGSTGLTTVNAFLDIREDLDSQDDTVLIRYATTDEDPDPLRIVTADRFDGAVWVPSQDEIPNDQVVAGGLPAPPGASRGVLAQAEQVSTSILIGPLAQSYLPLPYPTADVDVEGEWLYDARTLNVLSTQDTTEGLSYSVTNYDITPDAESLRDAPADDLDPAWTDLPSDMSDVVAEQAFAVTGAANAETRYDQALALQQWFRSGGGFRYSLDAPDTTDRDAVEAFLDERQGYCVQFASTMALMARSLDIPARVAVGFLPGEQIEPGQWQIRADDAHAWPELYFEGVGWVRFEPTPATRTGAPPQWAIPESDPAIPAPSGAPSQAAPLPPEDQPASAAESADAGAGTDLRSRVLAVIEDVLIVGMFAALAVMALLAPRTWRWWRNWRRLSLTRGDEAAAALATWTELLERLSDLDALPRGATVREQTVDIGHREQLDPGSTASLTRLAERCERATYAPHLPPDSRTRQDVAAVVGAVAASRSRRQQRAAKWFPAPSPVVLPTRTGQVSERVG